ncbi:WhiB family transcriptional regulator [Streptomyces violascens]|uniref:WhiB family transcriptional regulator n=1 Tax=Streptomyces violascens TaxID=67381 RepID=UPI0037B47209
MAPAVPRPNWQDAALCSGADPDLFFPEPGATDEALQEAKAICSRCPVRQDCLEAALRAGERTGICGGLTAGEREELLNPGARGKYSDRPANPMSAREVAMNHGADMLVWLVKHGMPVATVADRLSVRPSTVYQAFVMLVPARPGRPTVPSVIERVLAESQYCLETLERLGRSHQSIADTVGTSQNIVSACLRVLDQRREALRRVSRRDPAVRLGVLQDAETRVRREARVGLTVQDTIEAYGVQMLRLRGEGRTMRDVAMELGVNREAIRLAFAELAKKPAAASLTRADMESAA